MNKQEYKEHIYNWVKDHFGESEAEDPSWDIEALAEHLASIPAPKKMLWELEYDMMNELKHATYKAREAETLRDVLDAGFNKVSMRFADGSVEDGYKNGEKYYWEDNAIDADNIILDTKIAKNLVGIEEDADGYMVACLFEEE